MPPVVIFEHEQVTVWYDAEQKLIHHKMHKYTHGQIFRDALMAGVAAIEKHKLHKWLSDDRNNPVLTPEDQKWAAEIWFPRVVAASWKYWAIVQPEYVIAKMRMEKLAQQYAEFGVTTKFFTDPEAAMQWILLQ